MSETLRPTESSQPQPIKVWLRPNGFSWKISVETGAGAKWLTRQLEDAGFGTTELVQNPDDLHCTFRCGTTTRRERDYVEHLLIRWPEVRLQHSPEYSRQAHVTDSDVAALLEEPLSRPAEPRNVGMDVAPFRVWVRPLGNVWKVRAEGQAGSNWLRRELIHRGLTCTDPAKGLSSDMIQFRCMSETVQESNYVWNLLRALPQVLLQNDPA